MPDATHPSIHPSVRPSACAGGGQVCEVLGEGRSAPPTYEQLGQLVLAEAVMNEVTRQAGRQAVDGG